MNLRHKRTSRCSPTRWREFLAGLMATGLVMSGGNLVAQATQDSEEEDENVRMDEIVVTAEKREESILDVPLTMSAFSERLLEELGVTNERDLEQLVPGLQFAYDSEGNGIAIRGIGTQKAVQHHDDLAVAFYVDGVYTVNIYGIAPNMFDIERVEVGRGPQGTLHGRNSIAGSVSFINRRPTNEWDFKLLTEFTDQFSQRYNAAFGGPINDQWSFRINGSYFTGDGLQENVGIAEDFDAPDEFNIAPAIRYRQDDLDVNLRYQRTIDKGRARASIRFTEADRESPTGDWGTPNAWYLYETPIPSISNCPPGQFRDFGGICDDLQNKVLSNRENTKDNQLDRFAFNVDYQINDDYSIRYTFGANITDTFETNDGDGTDRVASSADPTIPADCLENYDMATCQSVSFNDSQTAYIWNHDESSHEVQVFTSFDGPLNFIGGIYAYENEASWTNSGNNFANPLMYTDADVAVQSVDRDEDGQPDFATCDEFLQTLVWGLLGRNPENFTACPEGDNHLYKFGSSSGATSSTFAAFLSADYVISDEWRIGGGLRWTEDDKELSGFNGFKTLTSILGVPIIYESQNPPRGDSWGATVGHVSIEWMPDDSRMYYGRISQGYRAGGFNPLSGGTSAEDLANNVVPPNFDAETLVNFEVGAKGKFFEDRLVLMAGAYFQDYDDFHFNALNWVPDERVGTEAFPFKEYTQNIDGTEIWGMEFEASLAGPDWRISGYYNYLDSSIGFHQSIFWVDRDAATELGTIEHTYLDLATGQTITTQVNQPRDNTGNQLPQQPNHKASISGFYFMELQDRGSLVLASTWSYTGDRWPDVGNLAYQLLPAYSRWDARVTWESPDSEWTVIGFVQNILNEVGVMEFAFNSGWLTDEREIGVQIYWRPSFF